MFSNHSLQEDQQLRNSKSITLTVVSLLAMFVLVARLLYLQVVQYDENLRLSESNRMRETNIQAARGNILDRNKQILARNRPSFQVAIVWYKVEDSEKLMTNLLKMRDEDGDRIFDSLGIDSAFYYGKRNRFQPQTILEDANLKQIALVEEHLQDLVGVITLTESRRFYPNEKVAGHVLGYTSKISKKQFKDTANFKGYLAKDRIGKKGLEINYEKYLKGKNGTMFLEIDAYGRRVGVLENMRSEEEQKGYHLVTTIDLDLQKVAEDALADTLKASIVALDPRNGEILAMVSSPGFDPNMFSWRDSLRTPAYMTLKRDKGKPFYNRSVLGTYPPGSLFKFFTTIAGLEAGAITKTSRYKKACNGGFQFGNRFQRCWKHSGHGFVNVVEALRTSCDVYFYQLGLEIGAEKINEYARMYGLGGRTGLDLVGEKRGLLMDSTVYTNRNKRLGWMWTRGQLLHIAIGQGFLVTPLQMAVSFGALGRGDYVYTPHFMKYLMDDDNRVVHYYEKKVLNEIKIAPETQEIVTQALLEVIEHKNGTGKAARVPGVRVGGKTGSAENPHGELTHAWFAAVAPMDDPTISIAVLVENEGHGGSIAAPIAGKILRYYFAREKEEKASE